MKQINTVTFLFMRKVFFTVSNVLKQTFDTVRNLLFYSENLDENVYCYWGI